MSSVYYRRCRRNKIPTISSWVLIRTTTRCAAALLCHPSSENDEYKWAITTADGTPPLVQILETGFAKAKEDSATILGNLYNHSEDIRA